MAYPYSVHKTYTAGEILTAADLNSTDTTHVNSNIPEDIDDYSANTTEMQTTADPYPGASESLAVALDGELQRLRYQILQIGKLLGTASTFTHWYFDLPDPTAATTILDIDNTATDGDPGIGFSLSGTRQFTIGVDDGDSDKFKVGTTAIGTNTFISYDGTTIILGDSADTGSAATPLITMGAATTTGIYTDGSDTFNISVSGVQHAAFGANQVFLGNAASNGSASNPIVALNAAADAGLYTDASDNLLLAGNGTLCMQLTSTQALLGPAIDGSAGTPVVALANATTTGFYTDGSDNLNVAISGAQVMAVGGSLVDILQDLQIENNKIIKMEGASTVYSNVLQVNNSDDIILGDATNTDDISINLAGDIKIENNKEIKGEGTSTVYSRIVFVDGSDNMWFGDSSTDSIIFSNSVGIVAQFDEDTTAGNTRMLIYDNDNANLDRVSVGAADSGGSGFKVLRIPN